MSDVSTFRVYLLRAMYLFTLVGLAIEKLPALLHPANLSPGDSVILSVLGATALLAVVGDPLPTQDAATAFLRVCVEVHLDSGFRAAPIAFRSAGSERKLRGDRNADCLYRGRRVGPARDALGLRTQTLFKGARNSVGQAGDRTCFRACQPR